MLGMSLLEREMRGVSPRGMERRCVYLVTTPKGEAVLRRWLELMEALFGGIPDDREPDPLR